MDNDSVKESLERANNQSDLIYTAILMKKFTNLQGMTRDLRAFAKARFAGLKVTMERTGNDYIDDVAKMIMEYTSK